MNQLKQIHSFNQSIWIDFIDRQIMSSGKLEKMISEDGIRGMTSNPAIFEKAISAGSDYNEDIKQLAHKDLTNDALFYELAIKDIQQAADIFKPVYEEKLRGADGYVSLEVSPHLARDTEGTIKQANDLWKAVNRENVMIKIPATKEGLPAIKAAIAAGINVNVTLLFGLSRYSEVIEAYISGLEERVAMGKSIHQIASVASFFISRIDTLVDPMLTVKGLDKYKGETAIALAKKAYEIFNASFNSPRFLKLQQQGATPQRLLWASTGTKDKSFSPTKYVDALIGPNTVDTVPMETLDAYRDNGNPADRLGQGLAAAFNLLMILEACGIDLEVISDQLEIQGIEKFNEPFDKILRAISKQREGAMI